jgi:hypothetical protein
MRSAAAVITQLIGLVKRGSPFALPLVCGAVQLAGAWRAGSAMKMNGDPIARRVRIVLPVSVGLAEEMTSYEADCEKLSQPER